MRILSMPDDKTHLDPQMEVLGTRKEQP